MLFDSLTNEEIVDSESALEFMKEATKLASSADLEDLSERVSQKSECFKGYLSLSSVDELDEGNFDRIVSLIFSIGRKSKRLIDANGFENLRSMIRELLHGVDPVENRFNFFVNQVEGIEEKMRINFAGELLHYSLPDRYWLWTNWIWDPDNNLSLIHISEPTRPY